MAQKNKREKRDYSKLKEARTCRCTDGPGLHSGLDKPAIKTFGGQLEIFNIAWIIDNVKELLLTSKYFIVLFVYIENVIF